MLSVTNKTIMLNVVMLNFVMPNDVMPNDVMLNVIMLNVIILNVIILNVVLLSVLTLPKRLKRDKLTSLFCLFNCDKEKSFYHPAKAFAAFTDVPNLDATFLSSIATQQSQEVPATAPGSQTFPATTATNPGSVATVLAVTPGNLGPML
jgi:hypothetical protein